MIVLRLKGRQKLPSSFGRAVRVRRGSREGMVLCNHPSHNLCCFDQAVLRASKDSFVGLVRSLTRTDCVYAALISTVRDLDAAFFGSASVSNPSLYSARTFEVSTVLGRENDRENEP